MNCVNHPQTAATAYCRTCGKALCAACSRNVRGVIYCEECLAARIEGQPAAAPGSRQAVDDFVFRNTGMGQAPVSDGPNPTVAGILSFFLPFGTGVMYCGEFTRALIHAGIFFGLIAAESTVHGGGGADVIFGLGIAFWYIFMIVDSVRVAKAKQLGQPIPDIFGLGVGHQPEQSSVSATSGAALQAAPGRHVPIGPIILIGIGVLFMLNSMDIWNFEPERIWPWFVIAVGFWMAYVRYQRPGCHCVRCMAMCMMGPALVVTTGVLGLLDEFTRWDWGRSWPLYLIVAGVIKMLQLSGSTADHIEPQPPAAPAAPAPESEVTHG